MSIELRTSRDDEKARYKCYCENIEHLTNDAVENWQCSDSEYLVHYTSIKAHTALRGVARGHISVFITALENISCSSSH